MKQKIWVLLYTPQKLSLKKKRCKALKQMSQLHESFRIQQQNENEAAASPKLDHVKHTSPKTSYARAPFKAFLHTTQPTNSQIHHEHACTKKKKVRLSLALATRSIPCSRPKHFSVRFRLRTCLNVTVVEEWDWWFAAYVEQLCPHSYNVSEELWPNLYNIVHIVFILAIVNH